jgi:hypothetical protein
MGGGGTGGGAGTGGMAGGFGGSTAGTGGAAGSAGSAGAAGSAGSGGMAPVAPDCSAHFKVTITANHMHVLNVTAADVMAGIGKVYDTTGESDHPHWVELTAADFTKLQMGGTVRKLTCNDEHEHEYVINCVGDAMPKTTSGIADKCLPNRTCAETMTELCPEIPDPP